MEEVRERQAELSKMRALMFYQERKQHHMNKIKSKVCSASARHEDDNREAMYLVNLTFGLGGLFDLV